MADRLVGQTLGRYRIVEKLGEGGMGVVFRAMDEKLGRAVALKVLGDAVAGDPERRRRFLREARLTAALTHANIATVYDIGEAEGGNIYIAMELAPGVTLRRRAEEGPLDVPSALRIASQLARALAKAHAQGIVHRDLKPENVMVSTDLDVKVLDFGLAKPIEDAAALPAPDGAVAASLVTEHARLLGTPGYMSPEQAEGRAVDARTDVFAFGVVLYEMLTRTRPFPGASAMEILIATSRDEPVRPSKTTPAVGRELERLVLRCLEKNADARYADGRELAVALAEVETSPAPTKVASLETHDGEAPVLEGSLAGASPTREPPGASARRRPLLMGAAALGVGVVVAALYAGSARTAGRNDAPRLAPSAAAKATAITDLPVPTSSNPLLVSEYVAGIQALRDDDWGIAESHFFRVVALDPMLAIGHLRLAMAAEGTLDEGIRREHYAKAVTLRAQLGARDTAMMEALEPVLLRLREDRQEAVVRLHELALKYPQDAEIQVWMGFLQSGAPALPAVEQAIAMDPRDGQAWQSRGDIMASLARVEESRASYERCGAISAASAECFLGLTWLEAMEGRCVEAEQAARRAVDRNPGLAGNLACAMAGAGRPIEAVHEVIKQAATTTTATWQRNADETRAAISTGDFVRARVVAEHYRSLAESDPSTCSRRSCSSGSRRRPVTKRRWRASRGASFAEATRGARRRREIRASTPRFGSRGSRCGRGGSRRPSSTRIALRGSKATAAPSRSPGSSGPTRTPRRRRPVKRRRKRSRRCPPTCRCRRSSTTPGSRTPRSAESTCARDAWTKPSPTSRAPWPTATRSATRSCTHARRSTSARPTKRRATPLTPAPRTPRCSRAGAPRSPAR